MTTETLMDASIAASTLHAYERVWAQYIDFARVAGLSVFDSSTPERYICAEVAAGHGGFANKSAALSHNFRRAARPWPPSPLWHQLIRGAERCAAVPRPRRDPLLPEHLLQVAAVLGPSTADRHDLALLTLAVRLARRCSDLADLCVGDVCVAPDGGSMVVTIGSRKTLTRPMPFPIEGTGSPACPVAAMRRYLAARTFARGERLFGLRGVLTSEVMSRIVRDAARRAGLPEDLRLSSHSCRFGGATAAARAGLSTDRIAVLGGWRIGSSVLDTYVGREHLAQLPVAFGL